MKIVATQPAVVLDLNSLKTHEFEPDEIELAVVSADDRSMGVEYLHAGTIEHPDLGALTWEVSEYPIGALNHIHPPKGAFQIIQDFDFESEYEDEYQDAENIYDWSIEEQKKIATHGLVERVTYLVNWFFNFYTDPVHDTPYNGREGGYIYIHGGPFNASDELYDKFGKFFSDEDIEYAVTEVEQDGTDEWAPSFNNPKFIGPEDEYDPPEPLSLDNIKERLLAGAKPRFNDGFEEKQRDDLLGRIRELEDKLDRYTEIGIGHNQPPEEIGELPANPELIRPITIELNFNLSEPEPDIEAAVQSASRLKDIMSYIGEKLNMTVDAFAKKFGEMLAAGAVSAATLAALGLTGFGVAFLNNIVGLFNHLMQWLDMITLPF